LIAHWKHKTRELKKRFVFFGVHLSLSLLYIHILTYLVIFHPFSYLYHLNLHDWIFRPIYFVSLGFSNILPIPLIPYNLWYCIKYIYLRYSLTKTFDMIYIVIFDAGSMLSRFFVLAKPKVPVGFITTDILVYIHGNMVLFMHYWPRSTGIWMGFMRISKYPHICGSVH